MLRAALTLDAVRATFRKKGYAFFDQGDYNLNVFGVRRENMLSDRFDDYLGAVYKDTQRRWRLKIWPATTDPGRYWLERPQNPAGTAILVPGQYRGAYQVGKHQGKYSALCQAGPVRVWRDKSRRVWEVPDVFVTQGLTVVSYPTLPLLLGPQPL